VYYPFIKNYTEVLQKKNKMANYFKTVAQMGQNLTQQLGSHVNQAFEQGLSSGIPEELRVGSHTVVVKEKLAEGEFQNCFVFL
jgi:hypothetical protein